MSTDNAKMALVCASLVGMVNIVRSKDVQIVVLDTDSVGLTVKTYGNVNVPTDGMVWIVILNWNETVTIILIMTKVIIIRT